MPLAAGEGEVRCEVVAEEEEEEGAERRLGLLVSEGEGEAMDWCSWYTPMKREFWAEEEEEGAGLRTGVEWLWL